MKMHPEASPLVPMALSDLLDWAFRIYRAQCFRFVRPVVLLFLPVLALQYIGVTWLAAPPLLVAMLGWIITVRLTAAPLISLSAQCWRCQVVPASAPSLGQTPMFLRLIGAQFIEALIVSIPVVFLFIYARWGIPEITDLASENQAMRRLNIALVITGLVMHWLDVYLWLTPLLYYDLCGQHEARSEVVSMV
ncbi:MAG: hypothetical protein MI924_27125 [Chloroflexales bacterium]|nr:hypothetical protein [Chloroflexales bacterium]